MTLLSERQVIEKPTRMRYVRERYDLCALLNRCIMTQITPFRIQNKTLHYKASFCQCMSVLSLKEKMPYSELFQDRFTARCAIRRGVFLRNYVLTLPKPTRANAVFDMLLPGTEQNVSAFISHSVLLLEQYSYCSVISSRLLVLFV